MNIHTLKKFVTNTEQHQISLNAAPRLEYGFKFHLINLKNFLIEELKPFPGRIELVTQILVLSIIWVIFAMSLELPDIWLSVYVIFLTSRRDAMSTAMAGMATLLGCSIALILCLLMLSLTASEPALRIPLMSIFIFIGMYATSILEAGRLALSIASMLAIMFGVVDSVNTPEELTRSLLWIWLAYAGPILLLVITNLIFSKNPARLFEEELRTRIRTSALALNKGPKSKEFNEFSLLYHKGMIHLRELQHMACLSSKKYKKRRNEDLALISMIDRLMASIYALENAPEQNEQSQVLMHKCGIWCLKIKDALRKKKDFKSTLIKATFSDEEITALPPSSVPLFLNLLERINTLLLAVSQRREITIPLLNPNLQTKTRSTIQEFTGVFVPDAFTNPEYLYFSLKTTLAAMLAYLFYMGTDWHGLRISVVTCIIVARSSYGETIHRLTMRLLGAMVGSFFGVLAIVFIIPYLDSIVGLILLLAYGGFFCAWASTGSERISFFGLQMSLAFFLCILQSFGPSFNLLLIRDSITGIMIGNIIMSIVFFVLTPSSATKPMRTAIAKNFDILRKMLLLENKQEYSETNKALPELRSRFERNMNTIRGYLPFVTLEPRSMHSRKPGSSRADMLLLEALFISVNTIAEHHPPERIQRILSPALKQAIWYCNRELAGWLIHYAYMVKTGSPIRPYRQRQYYQALKKATEEMMFSYDSSPLLRIHLQARLKWYDLLYTQIELAGLREQNTLTAQIE
ncbi:FUSC family protein [Desulfovibrio litoralis]|uniref:Uncharacterized membrane protein YccC n=1 Tax=Desulfovibrio litoralis DSM 11393 TaxID=1121455 RepID=A0A1M7TAY2_9BACT|nr:FUSC family protein [Desulfovibrio litoralis]SHN67890.1 Uncharacterized membrane protein YccC [Desulfovibrio litoralis DSM 11393]